MISTGILLYTDTLGHIPDCRYVDLVLPLANSKHQPNEMALGKVVHTSVHSHLQYLESLFFVLVEHQQQAQDNKRITDAYEA